MYPNWAEIDKIKNAMLRVVLYMATGSERERLEAAFPECYSENQQDIRVPATVVRELAYNLALMEGGNLEDPAWCYATDALGIPPGFYWVSQQEGGTNFDGSLPNEVREQLLGQELRCGLKVRYLDQDLLLVSYCTTEGGKLDLEDNYNLEFVLARFIDLNS